MAAPPDAPPPGRSLSLDTFRGITIAAMVLVNNPGSGRDTYAPLLHAEWNGWTPTDLIFPRCSERVTWRRGGDAWDALGLLGTLPSVASVLLGALAGRWIGSSSNAARKTVTMLTAGAVGVVAGMLWGEVFPINKNLWTSSFAIFSTGMALLLMAMCYWVVDVRSYRRWTHPFVLFGRNAIAVYVLSELARKTLDAITVGSRGTLSLRRADYLVLSRSGLSPVNASLAFAIATVLFWLGVVAVLDRRGIHVKVSPGLPRIRLPMIVKAARDGAFK